MVACRPDRCQQDDLQFQELWRTYLKGTSINSFATGKSSEIDASRGELLSDIRDYEGRDAGETLARIASP